MARRNAKAIGETILADRVNVTKPYYKKIAQSLLSLLVLIFISFVLSWLITIGILEKTISPITDWIKRSDYPYWGLFVGSFLFTCLLWVLLSSATELNNQTGPFEIVVKSLQSAKPFFALPVPVLLTLSFLSMVFLFLTRPSCEPPVIRLEVNMAGETKRINPKATIHVDRGSSITIKVLPQTEQEGLQCQWSALGEIFQKQLPNSSCVNTVSMTDMAGNGIITAEVSKDWCEAKSVIPVIVIAK